MSSAGLLLGALAAQPASALSAGSADANWPAPMTKFIERSENCMHFAGEFNGDGSARDAEINHRMDELRCNSLPRDLQALRKRYRNNSRITTRLDAYDDDGMPRDAEPGT
ncbi:hypothetical protein [Rhodanobacter sp. C01]|uniref:hypothetical protein n=1 Tax=Rhodanobacter sp. C01 TaxID=1945856 RepID=UPI00098465A2|nr:hypothetical protein [Rhodanobacter sp. C01]OOG50273.1 hypothetical protein B0E50_03870 [Rhodanobacter sp. C01]